MTRLDRGDGVELAYVVTPGRGPTLVFLPGFRSDMTGDKATMLATHAAARGCGMLRLDYSGHGASGGQFALGTVGRWTEDALFLIDRLTEGPIVLVGSSMGGWIALLIALARPDRVFALIGVAAAPDFTETQIWAQLPRVARDALVRDGTLRRPGEDAGERPITHALVEEGRSHLLLGAPIPIACPVRLLHGQRDDSVPWQTALTLADRLESENVQVTLVKDGDHRLSRPKDLGLLRGLVGAFLGKNGG